jgi:hypothetical protein
MGIAYGEADVYGGSLLAGSAPPDQGGGETPIPDPETPAPFVPPSVTDPSPGDGFNEAKAAASVALFFTGEAPTAAKQAELNAFASLHFEIYTAAGVLNPAMGPYEALGRGFADTIAFAETYGAVTEADFIDTQYLKLFGRDPTAAQQAHFQAQIDYFELIYENAGISSAQADLYAKGAALGQMIGHAVLDPIAMAPAGSPQAWDFVA